MRSNTPAFNPRQTYEGAPASAINAKQELRRSVLSCLLFEKEFYENGESIATRIEKLVPQVPPAFTEALMLEARSTHNLRHVPLFLGVQLARARMLKSTALASVIQRADEMGEFLALYWSKGKCPLSAQVKRGLAKAFDNFDEYQLAKYDRDSAIKLRDVMKLVHPNPGGAERSALYKGVIDRTLATPDTWEVALSGGADKKETFERLLLEGKLGYLALLRNLRNMVNAGVNEELIVLALEARKGASRVLPFRYVAAARAAPRLEHHIDQALRHAIAEGPSLRGPTVVLVDVSRSMTWPLSKKSDLNRMDAAATLASIINADSLRVFTFSSRLVEVPARRGMAGVDAVINSQRHEGTALFDAVAQLNSQVEYDRLIIITDEQADTNSYRLGNIQGHATTMPPPKGKGYVINVASARNGVGYGPWTHIDGFSESVVKFIHASEAEALA